MSSAENKDTSITEPEDNFDPHRFSAEPKRKSKNVAVKLLFAFGIVTLLIVGSVMVVKAKVSAYMEQRAEKRKTDDANRETNTPTRHEKVFSTASLPAGLGAGKASAPEPDANANSTGGKVKTEMPPLPPPASNGSYGNPNSAAPAPPTAMMLDEGKSESRSENSSAAPANNGLPSLPAMPGMNGLPSLPGLNPAQAKPKDGDPAAAGLQAPQFAGGATRPKNVQEHAAQLAKATVITQTKQATAANLGDRSYLLARGTYVPCVLETQLISSIEGNASCVLPQNIYSDDGRVLLLERGTKVLGSYKSQFVGDRIAILWERVKTPTGVVVDVDSPTADGVGTMGAQGVVERHWAERIGAAFLLSLVEDLVTFETAKATANAQTSSGVVVPVQAGPQYSATSGQTTSISKEVLKDTLNIKPTLVKNRGDRLMVYVNRDLWFDDVYKLTQH